MRPRRTRTRTLELILSMGFVASAVPGCESEPPARTAARPATVRSVDVPPPRPTQPPDVGERREDIVGTRLPNSHIRPLGTTGVLVYNCAPPPGTENDVRASHNMCLRSAGGVISRLTSRELDRVPFAANFPTWSPDGRRLLLRLSQPAGLGQLDDVGMVNASGTGFVNLTNRPELGNWGATWSPDGRRIVYNSGARLFVMNADGSKHHQITRFWGEYPAWSPDGTLIAFMSNRCNCNGVGGEAEYDVYVIRPDGTAVRQLTSFPGEEGVAGWSQDSRLIAFGRNPDRWPGIWIMTRSGRQIERIEPEPPPGIQLRGAGQWAPDGTFLMHGIVGTDPQLSAETSYWVSRDGERVKPLGEMSGPLWQPTGHGKVVTTLSLRHRWIGSAGARAIELSGTLSAGDRPLEGRRVVLGRLGEELPTRHVGIARTRSDGSFALELPAPADGPRWRVATAFYLGSSREWSTTAFDTLSLTS